MDGDENPSLFREMIRHEDVFRDQRLGWLFALNGFLFTGLSFTWNEADSTSLVMVLSAVGVLAAVSSAVALRGNVLAVENLTALAKQSKAGTEQVPVIALRSDQWAEVAEARRDRRKKERKGLPAGKRFLRWLIPWLYPWTLMPCALAAAWVFIAAIAARRDL